MAIISKKDETFATDCAGLAKPLLTITAAGAMALAQSRLPAANLIDHFNENSSTGSGASASWLRDALGSWRGDEDYQSLMLKCGQEFESNSVGSLCEQKETLLRIKHVFSLNAQQLAEAMGVSRAALYKWLDGSSEMRREKFERLQALEAIALRWQKGAGKPMRRTHSVSRDTHARFFDFLRADAPKAITQAGVMVDELLSNVLPQERSRKRLTEIAKERRWDPMPEDVVKANIGNTIPSVRLGGDDD